MEKIILWGTGESAQKVLWSIEDFNEIIAFCDNDKSKCGRKFLGKPILSSEEFKSLEFDKVVVCSMYFDEIKKQILGMGIEQGKIENMNYFHARRFLEYYNPIRHELDSEALEVVDYVNKYGISVFNYSFVEKYADYPVEVYYDTDKKMHYVFYKGKKMFMPRTFSEETIVSYVRGILKEQDKKSPHRYLTEDFDIASESVVVDVGTAEGNFALDVIDKVKKIYCIEKEDFWVEALHYTFEPFQDKVEIIEKFLGNEVKGDYITLDSLFEDKKIDFIKMDIEGAEPLALMGGEKVLRKYHPKLDICIYHNVEDGEKCEKLLENYDYQMKYSSGYMVLLIPRTFKNTDLKYLVHGLLRAEK